VADELVVETTERGLTGKVAVVEDLARELRV